MRIIAGEYRGRTIKALKGDTTRPTTDRIRESLMSTLVSIRGGFEGAIVLDAFAGSGALGLEAISRGASQVSFYEKNAAAFRILRNNIAELKLPATQVRLFHTDVIKTPPLHPLERFDLVFIDAPYSISSSVIEGFLEASFAADAFSDNVLVAYEHAKDEVGKELNFTSWKTDTQKNYGSTTIDIMTRHE